MAKTTKLTYKAAMERIDFLKRDNDAAKNIVDKAFSDNKALKDRNEELIKWRDDAKQNASAWVERAGEQAVKIKQLETKIADDRQTMWSLRDEVKHLKGQLDRCIGYIAAHHQEHPAPEATPTKGEETRAVNEYRDREEPRKVIRVIRPKWREDLGIMDWNNG